MAAGLPKTEHDRLSRLPEPGLGGVGAGVVLERSPRGSQRLTRMLFPVVGLSILVVLYSSPIGLLARHSAPFRLQVANRHSHGKTIICLGDSLTQGIGASPGHDYPSLLSKALGTDVINAGVDGDETEDALQRLETDVLAKDPRLVIVELGANDFLDRRPLKETFARLDEIVQRIEAKGAMVVLVGIPPGPMGDALQGDYEQLVQRRRIAFVPKILEGILDDRRLKSNDNLHPNDVGYELMSQRIRQVVEPLLRHEP